MHEEITDVTFDEKKLMGPASEWYKQSKEMLSLAVNFPGGNIIVEEIQATLMETVSADAPEKAATALARAQELFKKLATLSVDVPYTGLSNTMTKTHEPATADDGRYRYSGKSQGMVDQGTGEG
jgi:hypothetical protein